MHYEIEIQHPDTGTDIRIVWAFGRISVQVEDPQNVIDLGTWETLEAEEREALTEAYHETLDLVAPYKGRRARSLDAAERIGKKIAGEQWDWGFDRIE